MDEPSDSLTRRRFAAAGIATLAGIVPDRAGGDDLHSGVLRDEIVAILGSDVPDVAVTLDADPRQIGIGPLFLDNLDAQVAGPTAARLMVPMVMDQIREGLGTPSIVVAVPTRDVLIAWTPDSEAKQSLARTVVDYMHRGPYSRSTELFAYSAAGVRPLTPFELSQHGR